MFVCVPLLLYEVLFSKKADEAPEDTSDPWGSAIVDVTNWLTTSKICLFAGTGALSLGTYYAVSQTTRTTYFCSPVHDHAGWDFALQLLGLGLDTLVLILLWRVLWWADSTRARLHTLSSITRHSLSGTFLIFILSVIFGQSSLRFIHLSNALADGLLLFVFLMASSFLMCESTPLVPLSIVMTAYGTVASLQNVDHIKTWLHSTAYSTVIPFYYLCFGYSLILSRNHMNMLNIGLRVFIFFAMTATIFSCVPISLLRARDNDAVVRHPLDRLILNSRVEADRWLRKATPSESLWLAVPEYRERNHGRNPPPKFDVWYEFARAKNSVIIDNFDQIQKDLSPFWKVPADSLRERIGLLRGQPGVAMVQIRSGGVSIEDVEDPRDAKMLDGLVTMISHFSKHLPDMDVPVNLYDYPRVVFSDDTTLGPYFLSTLEEHRHMLAMACPESTAVGKGDTFQLRDLDLTYSKMSPRTQFIMNWEKAIKTCSQPDVMHLHGFHLSPPSSRDIYTHVPLFSRAKTGGFADIVIPLPRDEPSSASKFELKRDALYWRGEYGDPTMGGVALHGNHKHRLVHLFNNASAADETVVVLPVSEDTFSYSKVPTQGLNNLLSVDVGFHPDFALNTCSTPEACAPAFREFGASDPVLNPLEHRYTLLLDGDSGPATSPDFMATIRSESVPFMSSVFTEWFSERIRPWVHFVPVDLRYQGLHSAMAYFMGLNASDDGEDDEGYVEVTLGGRNIKMKGATEDAKWIATQGKTWASKALRKEDMEVYLFRLLLEWGRLVDDKREELGFVYEEA